MLPNQPPVNGDDWVKKYRFARFLCWVVIVAGLLGAVFMVLAAALGIFTILGAFLPYLLASAVGGVLVALVGFALLAFFDIAESLTREPPPIAVGRS